MTVEQVNELGKQEIRLICEAQGGEETDFRERMLEHNEIPGVLKFETILEGDNKIYAYRTVGMESVQAICGKHKTDKKEVVGFLKGILAAIYRGHEFMLSENDFVIRADTVFVSEQNTVSVVYCPGYQQDLRGQLCSLTEFLMDNIQYSDESAVYIVYTFYMKLRENSCSLESLMAMLNGNEAEHNCIKSNQNEGICQCDTAESRTGVVPVVPQNRPVADWDGDGLREITSEPVECTVSTAEVIKESPARLKILTVAIPLAILFTEVVILKSGILLNPDTGRNDVIKTFLTVLTGIIIFSGTERLLWKSFSGRLKKSMESAMQRADEATVMLYGDGTVAYPCSLVSDVFPPINISRFPFFIGSDSTSVDYAIERIGVSRHHLRIDRTGSIITVSDMFSTNGTFINGERLRPQEPKEIRRGDELKIGNCIYYCN